jgi:riboflavin synthase
MFTGIVEDLGEVRDIEQLGDFARIHVFSSVVTSDARPGDSICVNGVCLTVTGLLGASPQPGGPPGNDPSGPPVGFSADVMGETLARSSLKEIEPGTRVNLERSVRLEDRLGGHLVQGHVDGTGTVQARDPQFSSGGATPRTPRDTPDGEANISGADWEIVRISLPADLARYVVHKGSVTVDGISLTVSAIGADWFEVSLIPETLKRTTLGFRPAGSAVNLEVDVIAKYVEKLVGGAR